MYAIAHDERGVWGGTSRYERMQMPEYYVNVIRQIFQKEGILEYRSWLSIPVTEEERLEEQQLELSDPNVLQQAS